ncbi:MAG: DUF711 family protein [Gaiellales bacterium]|nr:DUF711 family protein [Gaiellales bacterium]
MEPTAPDTPKVVRTVCAFARHPGPDTVSKLQRVSQRLVEAGYQVQTLRICSPGKDVTSLQKAVGDPCVMLGAGTLDFAAALEILPHFLLTDRVSFNLDLGNTPVTLDHARVLFRIIEDYPGNTFRFAYTFNNPPSSPYFPSARFEREGFAVGLQPTNLAAGQSTLEGWLQNVEKAWWEVESLLKDEPGYLGLDSSVAPLFRGAGSLIGLARRLEGSFDRSVTSDFYLRITDFLRRRNPRPVGLCGLMLPCLEDFELADEYQAGRFPLERNLFLSMHCGLGVDTYPVGVDEDPERVAQVLRLVQGLSHRHGKPLSVRLVSDGSAGIGQTTDFRNQYLANVVIRPL